MTCIVLLFFIVFVISYVGLDDSHFQEVLDSMTEEEIQVAVAVNNQRNEEYRLAGLLPPESEMPMDLSVEQVTMELAATSTVLPYETLRNAEEERSDIENRGGSSPAVKAISRPVEEMSGLVNNATLQSQQMEGEETVEASQTAAHTHISHVPTTTTNSSSTSTGQGTDTAEINSTAV